MERKIDGKKDRFMERQIDGEKDGNIDRQKKIYFLSKIFKI